MTSTLRTDEQLRTALDKLEQCMETPVVPGNLETWLGSCRDYWVDVESALQLRIDEGHAEILSEIASQDPELLPRVELLLQEDIVLLKKARQLRNDADWLAAGCRQDHANQTKIDEQLQLFTKDSLEWVLRIRAQETAIVTWYQEAFNRDRGTGD
jgi:hypothetical protein